MLVAMVIGALVLVPALVYLYALFQRPAVPASGERERGGAEGPATKREGVR